MGLKLTDDGIAALGSHDWVITGCEGVPRISREVQEVQVPPLPGNIRSMVAAKLPPGDLLGLVKLVAAAAQQSRTQNARAAAWQVLVSKLQLSAAWQEFLGWLEDLYTRLSSGYTSDGQHAWFWVQVREGLLGTTDDTVHRAYLEAWIVAAANQGEVSPPAGSLADTIDWGPVVAIMKALM